MKKSFCFAVKNLYLAKGVRTMDINNNNDHVPETNHTHEALPESNSIIESLPKDTQVDAIEHSNVNEILRDEAAVNVDSSNHFSNNTDQYNAANRPEPGIGMPPIINSDTLRGSAFYTESYRKEGKKKNNLLLQMILISLISAMLGGTIVGVFFQFIAPAVEPYIASYLNKEPVVNSNSDTAGGQNNSSGGYKKVEIQKTDSPVSAIAEKASPSIVGIRVTVKSQFNGYDYFLNPSQGQEQSGEGSGIIIKSNGYIMTNNHVITGALNNLGQINQGSKIEVILPDKKNKPYTAQVIGRDETTDLAIIKINATNLPAAELGNSDEMKVGDQVVAIGNPGGLEYMGSVTSGVVSGLNRTITGENDEVKLIQTDAAINPGNSGGALLNSRGQVIGVNSVKIVSQGYEGLGFAIPVNKAKEITDSLMEYKYVKGRPVLGVQINTEFTAEVAKYYKVPAGLLVDAVTPLSGSYKAGIQKGDIIVKFDGKVIKAFKEMNDLKNKHKVGDEVTLEIYREGQTLTVKVTLTEDKG